MSMRETQQMHRYHDLKTFYTAGKFSRFSELKALSVQCDVNVHAERAIVCGNYRYDFSRKEWGAWAEITTLWGDELYCGYVPHAHIVELVRKFETVPEEMLDIINVPMFIEKLEREHGKYAYVRGEKINPTLNTAYHKPITM